LSTEIDWEKLAAEFGLLKADGELGGNEYAKRALEVIIGEDVLRASVDHYIGRHRGSELARSVLWQLKAVECNELLLPDLQRTARAVSPQGGS
jgi:hypothetical protein